MDKTDEDAALMTCTTIINHRAKSEQTFVEQDRPSTEVRQASPETCGRADWDNASDHDPDWSRYNENSD